MSNSNHQFQLCKLADYVINAIEHAYRRIDRERLTGWMEEDGNDIFDFKNNESGIKRRRRFDYDDDEENREEKIGQFLDSCKRQLQETYLTTAAVSDCERVIDFIDNAMKLNSAEKECLGLLAHYSVDHYIERFIDRITEQHRLTKNSDYGIFFKDRYSFSDLDEAWQKIAALGIIEEDCDDLRLSSFGEQLFTKCPQTYDEFNQICIGEKQTALLKWKDFDYVEKRDEICALLKAAVTRKEKGVNILLYGIPGTGKTEFARTVAQRAGAVLYSVGQDKCCNASGKIIHRGKFSSSRASALMFAGELASRQTDKVCLLLDEAEDIFYREDMSKRRTNTMLEDNKVPVIWTTNSIRFMDPAFLRRFTYSVPFELPDEKHSIRIWQKVLQENKLPSDKKTAKELCKQYAVPPSFMANAVKNERLIGGGINTVRSSLDNMYELCMGKKAKKNGDEQEIPFEPTLLNTDTDLKKLADRIAGLKLHKFSLCLYGAPGTGKSAYAAWLAEKLNRPVIKKRCSDLLSMWIGETEYKIQRAFAEAAKRKAILLFDEADSFLQDRKKADRSWETTRVNEMLTQMESAEHPFICTTNLIDQLDQASLRRFTFKVKYDFMTAEQRTKAFEKFFGFKNVVLDDYDCLTPADFALVYKKARILGIEKDKGELLKMLISEQNIKAPPKAKIGF